MSCEDKSVEGGGGMGGAKGDELVGASRESSFLRSSHLEGVSDVHVKASLCDLMDISGVSNSITSSSDTTFIDIWRV